jgi:TonB family protein
MHNPPLEKIKVAAPCKAEWRWMYGDDRIRFCGQCNQNVYNLSAMTREQAEDLILRTDGRLCVRFYRRADGTILTKNCSVGLQAIKDKFTSTRVHILAAILTFLTYFAILDWFNRRHVERIPMTGVMVMPPEPAEFIPPLVEKSEKFIRDKAVFKVIPVFHSAGAKRAKGEVVVRVLLYTDGRVMNAIFIEGDPTLKEMAEDAAELWRFEPTLVDGKRARVESRLTFQIGR